MNRPRTLSKTLRRLGRPVVALAALVALFLAERWAFAQQFEPFREGMQPRTDPSPFLLAAYGSIWVAMLIYVVMVARGLGRARAELEELRRKVERGPGAGA